MRLPYSLNCYFYNGHYVYFQLRTIVRSGLDVPTFATRRLHACHHARVPSGGKWNCRREMSGKFCLNDNFHVTFRDFFYMSKGGVLMILRPKKPTASVGCEPANLGTKGQCATYRNHEKLIFQYL
jgi:hypothetical protein